MRRWKKILSASLVAVMVGSLGMTAFAEDTSANEPIDTTVSNYNLTEEETSGKNQEEIKALQQQKIDEVTQQAYGIDSASPFFSKLLSASLIGILLTPSWLANSSVFSLSPMDNFPLIIHSISLSSTRSGSLLCCSTSLFKSFIVIRLSDFI